MMFRFTILLVVLLLSTIGAFAPPRPFRSRTKLAPTSLLATPTAEFAYQELRAQLDAMRDQGVASRDLDSWKRQELVSYVEQVASTRLSLPKSDLREQLPGTSWRLAFSTERAAVGDLPKDASVRLVFHDDKNLDYILQFSEKTFGLKNIKAQSKWAVTPETGVVSFVYEKITTDLFGMQNLGVGFFGLLKGRSNFIETTFFDNRFWMERGLDSDGEEFWNVYVKEG